MPVTGVSPPLLAAMHPSGMVTGRRASQPWRPPAHCGINEFFLSCLRVIEDDGTGSIFERNTASALVPRVAVVAGIYRRDCSRRVVTSRHDHANVHKPTTFIGSQIGQPGERDAPAGLSELNVLRGPTAPPPVSGWLDTARLVAAVCVARVGLAGIACSRGLRRMDVRPRPMHNQRGLHGFPVTRS
jgi:hypothetical protein